MKLYQIYNKGQYVAENILNRYNEPMNAPIDKAVFTTYEKAKENLPPTFVNIYANEYREYYIKEVEIE